MTCARCKLGPDFHVGDDMMCPDGGDSFTFALPPKKDLAAAVRNIQRVFKEHGFETPENKATSDSLLALIEGKGGN